MYVAEKELYDSLTRLSPQTRQVAEIAKRCTPSCVVTEATGFANVSATPPHEFVDMLISMMATAQKDNGSWYGDHIKR